MWTISLPLKIACDDRSKPVKHRPGWEQPYFMLNLNQYRNAHHQVLNNAKVNFEIAARKLIRAAGVPPLQKCSLEYELFPGSRQLCDVANVCSIVDKFFSDSLKASKIIQDDNYNFIADLKFKFGRIDQENPRVEVTIRDPSLVPIPEPVTREREPMKIQTLVLLSQDDLNAALREYLAKSNFTLPAGTNVFVDGLEDDSGYQLRFEPEIGVTSTPSTGRGRKSRDAGRLDPKAAMAALATSAQPQAPSATAFTTRIEERVAEAEAEEVAATDNEEPVEKIDHSPKTPEETAQDIAKRAAIGTCPDCKLELTVQTSSKLPSGQVIHIGCPKAPTQPVQPTQPQTIKFTLFKPPTAAAAAAAAATPVPYTVPSKEQQLAEAAAAVSEESQGEQETAPPLPMPVAPAKSLFSQYQRPKN